MLSLRVSVIDNCQLRCSYCLPHGPQKVLPKSSWLRIDQYQKLARVLRAFSLEKVRFTGGEPLLRPDLSLIIKAFADNLKVPLSLTTNGLRFLPIKHELKNAGLSGITFHLDTLKEEKYPKLMGPGTVALVLLGIREAQSAGFKVKINMVVQKYRNDDELLDFLQLSKDYGVEVRFIELMNTGSAKSFVKEALVRGQEILALISCSHEVTQVGRTNPADPALRFLADGIAFGLIASDSMPFCSNCNRLRLSANGEFRGCLYQPIGKKLDLDTLGEEEIAQELTKILAGKMSFHPNSKQKLKDFSMSQVGG